MIRRLARSSIGGLLAAALLLLPATLASSSEVMNFITRRGDQLHDGERPFRFISFNIPNLVVIEDAYDFARPNPWRWPDEFEIEDALESVRQMGGQVARTYVLSVYREGSDMGDTIHVRRPGEFNEEGFRTIDKVMEVARRKGIRVIVPFVDQHKWWGGIGEYAAFRAKPADAFWSDPQIKEDFKATIRYLLTRKNTYTGVEYRDDPAIFAWETGNEIEPTAEWTREIAAYIKSLDKNHLVIDGKSLHGLPKSSLDDPNVDVLSTHHYPWGEDHDFSRPIREAHALTKGKKPYFVGEFGFVETPQIAKAIQTVIDDGISGALLWSLRMHRREGGFYWHMEVGTGRNIYKAFHWPGFASGDRYDERVVMSLMRDKAHEIRGLPTPPLEPPASPKLLPIEKASAISWQGSTGAAAYDVLRAPAAEGPWSTIAEGVSDAEVQYRPLFHDASAKPGQAYWYRVVARNAAGESKPSNVVGPVLVNCRTLVDECQDLSLVASTNGKVQPASENARTVQEDCHRLSMSPGSSIVYHVERPLGAFRVFTFGSKDANLDFEVSADGKKFHPAETKREAFSAGETVYGYRTPVLFSGNVKDKNATYLRIAFPGAPPDGAEGNTGTSATDAKPTIELSRIEIEYDSHSDSNRHKDAASRTQVNSAIFVYTGRPVEPALEAIDGAAKRGERQLNVVVTVLVDLTEDLRIKTFGGFASDESGYRPCDSPMRDELRDKLRRVFARMAEHGMNIFVLPHIDAGGRVRQWRNWVDFDPLESYGGYTYDDLVLTTIAGAAAAAAPQTRLELALSGEMGTSLFLYPESYRSIVRRLRQEAKPERLKLGISLNHSGLAGRNNPNGAKDIVLTSNKRREMQALIDECDFVGMSFYAPVSVSPTPDDFVGGIGRYMKELAEMGLTVPASKPMQFSEVGIGGRQAENGAVDPGRAVAAPWEGTANPKDNPWTSPPMRQLRRDYHNALLQFLDMQPADWKVSSAFFWSMGSWDPVGHGDPVFADDRINADIEAHNRAAAGQ